MPCQDKQEECVLCGIVLISLNWFVHLLICKTEQSDILWYELKQWDYSIHRFPINTPDFYPSF